MDLITPKEAKEIAEQITKLTDEDLEYLNKLLVDGCCSGKSQLNIDYHFGNKQDAVLSLLRSKGWNAKIGRDFREPSDTWIVVNLKESN